MVRADELQRDGRAAAARGDHVAAFRAFARAAQADPAAEGVASAFLIQLASAGQKARARRLLDAENLPGPLKKRLAAALKDGRPAASEGVGELAALVRAGDIGGVRALSDRLIARSGDHPAILNLRAIAEIQAGAPEQGEVFLRRALARDPDVAGAASNLGFALLLQGKAEEAAAVLEGVLEADPANLDARTNLASAAYRLDRPQRALGLAEAVLAARPGDETAQKIRAQCLWKSGRSREALDVLRVLEAELGDRFDLWRITAKLIEETEGPEAAADYLSRWSADHVKARLRRAILLAETGNLAAAEAEYRAVLEDDPSETEALYLLALQGELPANDPVVRKVTGLDEATLSDDARAHLHYGLGKAFLDADEAARAFGHFDRANAAQRPHVSLEGARLPEYLTAIREAWDADRMAHWTGHGAAGIAPIFVVGIQRSGSTLTEQILSAHPQVTGLGEQSLFYHGFRSAHRMTEGEFAETVADLAPRLRASAPTPRMVDKFLGNFRQLGAIAAAFPEAVIVNPRRDPRSIALSVYQNRFDPRTFPWTTSLEDIAAYYLEYDRHMAHWNRLFGDRILSMDYEDLVSDPEPAVRRLLAHCRLDWDPACLRPELVRRRVDTLSIGQVRRGIHAGSRARWRRFESELRPFIDILSVAGLLRGD